MSRRSLETAASDKGTTTVVNEQPCWPQKQIKTLTGAYLAIFCSASVKGVFRYGRLGKTYGSGFPAEQVLTTRDELGAPQPLHHAEWGASCFGVLPTGQAQPVLHTKRSPGPGDPFHPQRLSLASWRPSYWAASQQIPLIS